jgi:aspartate-semialdehyde dehydrogenase
MPDKEAVRASENAYAQYMPVFSNASAHRSSPDVPMLVAEINPDHLTIIPQQQKKHGWKGCLVVKPNCSLQSYLTPLYALMEAGYDIDKVMVTTMQAVSGAGYPGVPSLDMIDNVVPYIGGEEEKTEQEPLKILGTLKKGEFVPYDKIRISAHCNRVPVTNGHLANVSISFKGKKPTQEQILAVWQKFSAEPQKLDLPMAPVQPIRYREEPNRPQPKRDRDTDKGMTVTVGRLRACPVFDYKFSALSHNTIRGAAGGGILNAELVFHTMPELFGKA